MTATNVGKWDRWFALLGPDWEPFGQTETYELAATWLKPCALVADWGCGKGWMRHHIKRDRYYGVDGSRSPFADEIADLADYHRESPGIVLRHVLEHDYRWERILANACAAFQQRMALVLFTPLGDTTREIAYAADPGVPDISFAFSDIKRHLEPFAWRHDTLSTASQYGTETIFYVERP